jgi:hypothetical protein
VPAPRLETLDGGIEDTTFRALIQGCFEDASDGSGANYVNARQLVLGPEHRVYVAQTVKPPGREVFRIDNSGLCEHYLLSASTARAEGDFLADGRRLRASFVPREGHTNWDDPRHDALVIIENAHGQVLRATTLPECDGAVAKTIQLFADRDALALDCAWVRNEMDSYESVLIMHASDDSLDMVASFDRGLGEIDGADEPEAEEVCHRPGAGFWRITDTGKSPTLESFEPEDGFGQHEDIPGLLRQWRWDPAKKGFVPGSPTDYMRPIGPKSVCTPKP